MNFTVKCSDGTCNITKQLEIVEGNSCADFAGDYDYTIDESTPDLPFLNVRFGSTDYRGLKFEIAALKGDGMGAGSSEVSGTSTGSAYAMYLELEVLDYDSGTKTITIDPLDWDDDAVLDFRLYAMKDSAILGDISGNTIDEITLYDDLDLAPGDMVAIRMFNRLPTFIKTSDFMASLPASENYKIEIGNVTDGVTGIGTIYCAADPLSPYNDMGIDVSTLATLQSIGWAEATGVYHHAGSFVCSRKRYDDTGATGSDFGRVIIGAPCTLYGIEFQVDAGGMIGVVNYNFTKSDGRPYAPDGVYELTVDSPAFPWPGIPNVTLGYT